MITWNDLQDQMHRRIEDRRKGMTPEDIQKEKELYDRIYKWYKERREDSDKRPPA